LRNNVSTPTHQVLTMKMTSLAVATLSAVLALGMAAPAAQAAGDRDDRRGHHGWDDRGRGHDRGHDRRDDRRHYSNGYREGYRDARRNDYYAPPRAVYRNGPPPHGWARGHDYRRGYRGPVYVVNDYSRYDLRRPPRGHHWIRDDRGNMLLVAVATGIIADLLMHH
jgi:Ni/Co efflux regulator RcnB